MRIRHPSDHESRLHRMQRLMHWLPTGFIPKCPSSRRTIAGLVGGAVGTPWRGSGDPTTRCREFCAPVNPRNSRVGYVEHVTALVFLMVLRSEVRHPAARGVHLHKYRTGVCLAVRRPVRVFCF